MNLVDIRDLHVSFRHHDGVVQAVRGVSMDMPVGESLGVVGESGSGKSVTLMALTRLLKAPAAQVRAETLQLLGQDLLTLPDRELSGIRGSVVSMIFQDPMTSFDPLFTIGHQIAETILAHRPIGKKAAMQSAGDLLRKVEIRNSDHVLRQYPVELSGGMLQRAMIAMALSCEPQLLIADEPTTALDVTVQAQILQLIKTLQAETGMSLIIVTHDLGVVAETTDRVIVMYGGRVMEIAGTTEIFANPRHPYTRALLDSVPGREAGKRRLKEIPGASPNPLYPPPGCPFHKRCPSAIAKCAVDVPPLEVAANGHATACWKPAE